MTDQSAADRIAAAPRAWAVIWPDGSVFTYEDRDEARPRAFMRAGSVITKVALVPLTEKEAQQ